MVECSCKPPFVMKCLEDGCTMVHAGMQKFSANDIETEINSGSEFGKKLKLERDKVVARKLRK